MAEIELTLPALLSRFVTMPSWLVERSSSFFAGLMKLSCLSGVLGMSILNFTPGALAVSVLISLMSIFEIGGPPNCETPRSYWEDSPFLLSIMPCNSTESAKVRFFLLSPSLTKSLREDIPPCISLISSLILKSKSNPPTGVCDFFCCYLKAGEFWSPCFSSMLSSLMSRGSGTFYFKFASSRLNFGSSSDDSLAPRV